LSPHVGHVDMGGGWIRRIGMEVGGVAALATWHLMACGSMWAWWFGGQRCGDVRRTVGGAVALHKSVGRMFKLKPRFCARLARTSIV